MKTFDRCCAILILVATTGIAYGQESKPRAGELGKSLKAQVLALQESVRALRLLQSFNGANPLFLGSPTPAPCSPANNSAANACMIDAKITELFDKNGVLAACAVQTSNITISNAHKNDKIYILWNKVDPSPNSPPSGATYKFEGAHGLLISKDGDDETGKKADTTSDTSVMLIVTYKKLSSEVDYYPLILQTRSDGTEFLCGAGDPTIVNN